MNDTRNKTGQTSGASSPTGREALTVLEVRQGRGPKPPYRVLGLTSTDPIEAVRQMSDAIRIGIKEVRAISDDGYQYGIPALDGMPTYVRARLFQVTEVAGMVSDTMGKH